VTLLLVVAVLAFGGTVVAAATGKPLPCPGGRFVLPAGSTPLVVGGSTIGPDAVIVSDGQVSIASGCDATTARLRRGKNRLFVKAAWQTCGAARRVRLKARVEAPSCNRLTGRVKAKGAPKILFEATLVIGTETTTTTSVVPATTSTTTTIVPATTSTTMAVSTSTTTTATTSTTTTTCLSPCEAVLAECGELDDGCGHSIYCGSCPSDRPVCLDAHCYGECSVAPEGTPCDANADPCVVEECRNGSCMAVGAKQCPPTPCYAGGACNSANGECEPSGYAGDGTPCRDAGGAPGFCDAGACSTTIACWVNGSGWLNAHPNPANPFCEACQPGLSTTEWTDVADGTPCPTGLCVAGSCHQDICVIDGVTYDAGDQQPTNACRSCQPAVSSYTWTAVADGGSCADGLCIGGSCDDTRCVINGAVHQAGAQNPSNPCQLCDPSTSRTAWTSLPDNTVCGQGCLTGICNQLFGGCVIAGAGSCPSTDCAIGACDVGTRQCINTPINAGGACSELSVDGCQATDGTCNASGICVRAVAVGQACTPQPHTNPCYSTLAGTCDASGQCTASQMPAETPCGANENNLCNIFRCRVDNGSFGCISTIFECPQLDGCSHQVCDRATGLCHPERPNSVGTRVCDTLYGYPEFPCCPGTPLCECPLGLEICFERYCYGTFQDPIPD